jgi:hypothetical protein
MGQDRSSDLVRNRSVLSSVSSSALMTSRCPIPTPMAERGAVRSLLARCVSRLSRPGSTALLALSAVAPVLAVAACSSSSSPSSSAQQGAGGDEAGTVGCSGQGQTYTANMVLPGKDGVYTFTLVQAQPAPPDLNGNVWTFEIADKTGAAPDVSRVIAYPFMPLMGHPSDQTPTVTANADGSFTATDIDLFMPGLWTITLEVTQPDAGAPVNGTPLITDEAVYSFCVN